MPKKAPPHAWKPGQSGNPSGRKPGTGKVAAMREAIAAHVPEMVETLIDKARGGDVQAARLLIERVIPPMRAAELAQPLTLPDGSLTDQGRAVLRSVAAGELAPGQGAQLLAAIAALGRTTEIDELARRLDALEQAAKGDDDGND
jgi:hypothetical protein